MIVGVEGLLEQVGSDWVVLKLGGVSLQIHVPTPVAGSLGADRGKVKLYTHLHVREDNIALYGFASQEELDLFELLLGVSGVGPRVALGMLSVMSPRDLSGAILGNNVGLLTQMPGVGKKMAGRLVLELKSKLERGWAGLPPSGVGEDNADIVAALTALGYSVAESSRAAAAIPSSPDLSLEDKVKLALQQFTSR